jgi:ubiquinone/menaquinone biosynthesis C-methylase UbiE
VEDVRIILLNVVKYEVSSLDFKSVKGDARNLKFPDGSFDMVFLNFVIEPVGKLDNQIQNSMEVPCSDVFR